MSDEELAEAYDHQNRLYHLYQRLASGDIGKGARISPSKVRAAQALWEGAYRRMRTLGTAADVRSMLRARGDKDAKVKAGTRRRASS